jgi:regulator of sigma E protease
MMTMLLTLLSKLFFVGVGLLGISFLIGFHELGHFLFCKLFNIPTSSFSIGIGPRIWEKKIDGTVFALSVIPFGGYVEISEEVDPTTSLTPFRDRPYYQKLLVMCGGIMFNIFFAYTAFIFLFAFGAPNTPLFYPRNALSTINEIAPDSPASTAGLLKQDTIVRVNDNAIKNFTELLHHLDPLAHKEVMLTIVRNGQPLHVPVTLGSHETPRGTVGYLGITPTFADIEPLPWKEALYEGFSYTNQLLLASFTAFITIAKKRSTQGLGGPLMLISATMKGAQQGLKIFLFFLAFISINLAVLNVFPLPVLDGGQILLTTIETVTRRQISDTIRWYIFALCWLCLLSLMIYLSINDIRLIFGNH